MPFDDDVIDVSNITDEQRRRAYRLLDSDPCNVCWSQYTCRWPHKCKRHDDWLKEYTNALQP